MCPSIRFFLQFRNVSEIAGHVTQNGMLAKLDVMLARDGR
jgi:hypothetical protein